MIKPQNQSTTTITLLTRHSHLLKTLLKFITISDIVQLQLTSKEMYEAMASNAELSNWLYYAEYLAIEHSYTIDLETYALNAEEYTQRIWNVCSNEELNFSITKQALRQAEDRFITMLTQLIDKAQAHTLLHQLKRILLDPQPPRPVMRRKTVGDCCRTPVQIKIATEGYSLPEQIYLSQEDETLKRALLEKADSILESLSKPDNMELVMEIRYRGELSSNAPISDNSLIGIIQLIFKISGIYIASVRLYLEAAKRCLPEVEFLQEYSYRYAMFRNSVIELDEKFQYLFQHFEFAFKEIYRSHPFRPRFYLWRIMVKQWNAEMKEFNDVLSRVTAKVFVQIVEKEVESLIVNETADEETYSEFKSNCFILEKFKAPQCSDLNTLFYETSSLCTFFQQYTEYLVDISSNPLNVHWYGSSELRLGAAYCQFQHHILQQSKTYFQSIINLFSSLYVKIKLCEFFVESSRNYLKPCTASKLQSSYRLIANQLMEKFRQNQKCSNWSKEWAFPCYSYHYENAKIKEMNKSRKVAQETAEEYIMFFSLETEIQISSINEVVSKYRQDHMEVETETEPGQEVEESRLDLG